MPITENQSGEAKAPVQSEGKSSDIVTGIKQEKCPECKGSGDGFAGGVYIEGGCPTCKGTGLKPTEEDPRSRCKGDGNDPSGEGLCIKCGGKQYVKPTPESEEKTLGQIAFEAKHNPRKLTWEGLRYCEKDEFECMAKAVADHATKALQQRVEALEGENKGLKRDLELAIAHDRQPYPTAWAYEQACRVSESRRVLINSLDDDLGIIADVVYKYRIDLGTDMRHALRRMNDNIRKFKGSKK